MGSLHREQWVSTGLGSSRRQRASGVYYWYLPDRLMELDIALDSDVIADVTRAERNLALLTESSTTGTEGITRLLMRSESVASSQIEGLSIGTRRLVRAELQEREPESVRYDKRAATVLGNIRAMERAREMALSSTAISVEMLQSVHERLCVGTAIERWGGVIREMQNWVGGSSSNPLSAEYVPPAPTEVPALLDDLVAFANRDDISPVVQAAMCHAQFESIHPFVDGNGRVGRALIYICLQRRGTSSTTPPPVSLSLATNRQDYFDALRKYQHANDPESLTAAINDWVSVFASAVSESCEDVKQIVKELSDMRKTWKGVLGSVRRGSTLESMLTEIQSMPIFTVHTMVEATGRSKQSVSTATNQLASAGIIRQTSHGKRSRVFEVPDVLEEFSMVERRIASPARDTNTEPPNRTVPNRQVW